MVISGADYLVTNDKHFKKMKKMDFPKINVVKIDTFKNILVEHKIRNVR
jgi:hypothetical protein